MKCLLFMEYRGLLFIRCVRYFWVRVPALLSSNCQAYVFVSAVPTLLILIRSGSPGRWVCVRCGSKCWIQWRCGFYISSSFHNIFHEQLECIPNVEQMIPSIYVHLERIDKWDKQEKPISNYVLIIQVEMNGMPSKSYSIPAFPRRWHAMWPFPKLHFHPFNNNSFHQNFSINRSVVKKKK